MFNAVTKENFITKENCEYQECRFESWNSESNRNELIDCYLLNHIENQHL